MYCLNSDNHTVVLAGVPRQLNISGELSQPSYSSLAPASTLLQQAPADYCGLCIIEAPGGIRLVYWVCLFSQILFLLRTTSPAKEISVVSFRELSSFGPLLCYTDILWAEDSQHTSVIYNCSKLGLGKDTID